MSDDATERPVIGPDAAQPAPIPPDGRQLTMAADITIIDGHLKIARGGRSTAEGGAMDVSEPYEFYSDEPEHLGGEGRYPQPLLYLSAGIGF